MPVVGSSVVQTVLETELRLSALSFPKAQNSFDPSVSVSFNGSPCVSPAVINPALSMEAPACQYTKRESVRKG